VGDLHRVERGVEQHPLERRPHEHVQREQQGAQQEQSRAEGLGAHADLPEHPRAQVLEGHDVAAPAAEEAAEDQRREDGRDEEDEPGVDLAELERVHRLAGFDGGEGHAVHQPLHDVRGDEHVDEDEHHGPAAGVARRLGLAGVEDWQGNRLGHG
jgi:hypothetical protein